MVRVIDNKMIFTRIFLITVCVVLVSSMTSQIREISNDQKRSPFSGRCHYRPTNMINECCPVTKPKDCRDIDPAHCKSGVYTIYPVGTRSFDVYCKLINQGKAWTVIQTRFNGQIIFNRTWKDYEYGFGNINGEHWLGNEKIHILTSKGNSEFRIQLEDFDGETRYALYRNFSVGDAKSKYKLSIGGYSGNAGDCPYQHNDKHFSTPDEDNDTHKGGNCADYSKAEPGSTNVLSRI